MKIVILILVFVGLAGTARGDGNLEDIYWAKLDAWVNGGGNLQTIQANVVETCGKLTVATATKSEVTGFLTTEREEFDWRVDVCTKSTVHRVYPQPEFDNPEIVSMICGSNVALYQKVCERSGLKN